MDIVSKLINFKWLNILIEFNIPYGVIVHKEDYFLYIENEEDMERFKKIKKDIKVLKEKYNGN